MQEIDRYEIIRELGRGGVATVYLASDPRIQREVAIKVLPRQFTHDPKYLARFEQEAQMIATLEHPAIVPVYDFGDYEDAPFLVMRYMPGGSLRDRLSGEPLSLEEIVSVLGRLAPAIDYAHEFGIIHRDLKPANVFFDDDGRPYLADFGIARLAEASQTMTVIGTPAYMSPEQVEGDQAPDGRADIYALGVMLYEMLTGEAPYAAETPTKQMVAHILKPVPDVLESNPDLPPETQAIVEKSMAKDRDERYATAGALVTGLKTLPGLSTTVATERPPAETDSAAETVVEAAMLASAAPTLQEVEKTDSPPDGGAGKEPPPTAAAAVAPPSEPTANGDVGKSNLPGWIWWAGALALLLIAVLGIRAIIGGGSDDEGSATPTEESVAEVVPIPSPTNTPRPTETPQEEPSPAPTSRPSDTPVPSTATAAPTLEPTATPILGPPLAVSLGDSWDRTADGMTMVFVPAGSFTMGSGDHEDQEAPEHEVTLDAFWIDRTEVTNANFAEFVADTGYKTTAEEQGSTVAFIDGEFQSSQDTNWQHPLGPDSSLEGLGDYPVVHVSWDDAQAYCTWADARLPTEAEWEYAARGPRSLGYPWGEDFESVRTNYCDGNCPLELAEAEADDGYEVTSPTGRYPAGTSWVGALDMSGNVWEWVNDWYAETYYAESPRSNPQGPLSGESRVLRGGSWVNDGPTLRASNRSFDSPDSRGDGLLGFRCVVELSSIAKDPDNAVGDEGIVAAWTRSGDGMTMVHVPAGSFLRGSEGRGDDEVPVREVNMDAFWIDRTEVTNAQFAQFVEATGRRTLAEQRGSGYIYNGSKWAETKGADWRHPQGADSDLQGLEDHPVVHASWHDATAYCEWVDARLPTEAEWEYAARGPQSHIYPWGDSFDNENSNFCDGDCPFDWVDTEADDGYEFTAPVGTYPEGASWIGALDMTGNVWEWVNDWYDKEYYVDSAENNPQGPDSGEKKVMRGGAWNYGPPGLRSAYREGSKPNNNRTSNGGFRCVVAPGPAPTEPIDEKVIDARTRPDDGMTMLLVPSGSYLRGSEGRGDDEVPVREVNMGAFWIDRTEVTNAQFAQFVEATGHRTLAEQRGSAFMSNGSKWAETKGADWLHPQGPESDLQGLDYHPVVDVSWHDATAYCRWVDARLPTEAEWEYAARGPQSHIYPWGDSFDNEKSNFCDGDCPFDWVDTEADDGYEFTAPVGTYPEGASWIGVLDMTGNVWEWVNDWYGKEYYVDSEADDPQGPQSGEKKVMRGGAWNYGPPGLRSAYREGSKPNNNRTSNGGFRCVTDLDR